MLRLVYQLGENYPRPPKYTYIFGVPLGHLKENYRLTRGQNHLVKAWAKDLMALNKTIWRILKVSCIQRSLLISFQKKVEIISGVSVSLTN